MLSEAWSCLAYKHLQQKLHCTEIINSSHVKYTKSSALTGPMNLLCHTEAVCVSF